MECICGSQEFVELGTLGDLHHFRCRACGYDTSLLAINNAETIEPVAIPVNEEALEYEGENDYELKTDHPEGVWIKIDNLVVWLRRWDDGSGVVIDVCRASDIEYTLDTLSVREVI